MTTKYDDKILELTGNWKFTNDIVRKIGGDKSAIVETLKILENIGYLQTKPDKNKLVYKKNDDVQSEFNFLKMMEIFESSQKIEINFIKQIPTIMKFDGIRLREKGLNLLEHIQDDVDRAYLVMLRIDHHEKTKILTPKVAHERKKILETYIHKILNFLLNKYSEKPIRIAIQKYFQNNGMKFEFNF